MARTSNVLEVRDLVLIEDEPVPSHLIDDLAVRPFSQIVAEAALGTGGPFTIGVFADWGTGKTSVLRQAKSLVESAQRANVATVWFNAWQFEREEHPIVPLVASIVKSLESKRHGAEGVLKETMSKLTRALRALAYGFEAKTKVKVPGFSEVEASFVAKEMIERYEKLQSGDDPLLERSLYYSAFELLDKVVEKRLENAQPGHLPKVVVFVDDLDRCTPDKGVHLLESIKLVLSQPGFVFVLAVDRSVLESYLKKLFKEDFGLEGHAGSGVQYLDKIVQLPINLPSHETRFDEYVRNLAERKVKPISAEIAEVIASLAELLRMATNSNPRNLVRLLNNLLVDTRLRSLMKLGDGLSDAEFLGLCAVDRTLRQYLGASYAVLANDSEWCQLVAEGREEAFLGRAPRKDAAESFRESRRQDVIRHFERLSFLNELLKSTPGQRWLRDASARKMVGEFVAIQRESPPAAGSGSNPVLVAIRKVLGLTESAELLDSQLAKVTELDLSGTDVTDDDLAHLAQLSALRGLSLYDTQIGDAGVAHLARLSALQRLWLSDTHVDDAGLGHLAQLNTLQGLSLSGTRIGDVGLAHLARLSALNWLSLDGTQVGDAGLAYLAQLFALHTLSLDDTQVSDAGLAHLAKLSSLQTLSLGGTRISDAGLTHLANLNALEWLSLDRTQVSDAGLAHLAKLSELQELWLGGTQVSEGARNALRSQIPNLTIVG